MARMRGRPRTFRWQTRKYFARLVERFGVSGARTASKILVSRATLMKVAKEFGIQLRTGPRCLDISRNTRPRLNRIQKKELRQILIRGAIAAGCRSDNWTVRRVSNVVTKYFGEKCDPVSLKPVLLELGFKLVGRRVFQVPAGKSTDPIAAKDTLRVASQPLKAA